MKFTFTLTMILQIFAIFLHVNSSPVLQTNDEIQDFKKFLLSSCIGCYIPCNRCPSDVPCQNGYCRVLYPAASAPYCLWVCEKMQYC